MAIKEFVIEPKKLKTEYDKIKKSRFGWLQVLFFPRALKSALENPNSSSLDIVAAAFKSTWFFHLWFFPKTLRSFFKSDYVKSGQWLFGNQINLSKFDELTKDFQTQEKDTLASVLCSLHDASDKKKSERNLDLIKQHKNATHVLHAILISNKHNDFDGNDLVAGVGDSRVDGEQAALGCVGEGDGATRIGDRRRHDGQAQT